MYQLGSQFEVDLEKGKAPSTIVISGSKYRITVLTERLIRLEYNENGKFVDNLTQLVLNRDFKACDFDVKQDAKFLEIKTKYFRLEYLKEKPFFGGKFTPLNNLKVTLLNTGDNEKVWYYGHPEVRNFGSSGMSIDESSDKVIYRKGLYSLDGFASIDDSNSLLINNDGTLSERDKGGIDIYLFMYNRDFYSALKDYFVLTGYPPLIPRYALGNWWSRDKAYDAKDIKEIVDNFERIDVPISIFMLDRNWHITEANDKKDLVTGFTFNKKLIPNPTSMIEYLHSKNIRIGLSVNPKQGIYPHEEYYSKVISYLNVEADKIILFDPLNPKLLDIYLKLLIHPLEMLGIDFFGMITMNLKRDYLYGHLIIIIIWILVEILRNVICC